MTSGSSDRFWAFVNQVPVVALQVAPDGSVVGANAAAMNLLVPIASTKDFTRGPSIFEDIAPDVSAILRNPSEDPVPLESYTLTADLAGRVVHRLVRIQRMDGALLVLIRDATEEAERVEARTERAGTVLEEVLQETGLVRDRRVIVRFDDLFRASPDFTRAVLAFRRYIRRVDWMDDGMCFAFEGAA